MSKIFITGGTGCIGAVTVFKLLTGYGDQIEQVRIASRSSNTDQLEIWLGDKLNDYIDEGKVSFLKVDIGDSGAMRDALQEFAPTHLIHLGALQSPACAAQPEKGVAVNLTGTLTLFETVAELEKPLERFVFASSGAVYGKRSIYPGDTVPESAQLAPPNLYGVWKVAGEHLAALFHEQTNIPTVSLRLNTTYGPGRDLGTTSAPTKVMKSLALGANEGKTFPSRMPYKGRENYHYVEDVGAHFAGVCMMPFSGCEAFNIKGKTIEVTEFLETIAAVSSELEISDFLDTGVEPDATPNLFICDLDDSLIEQKFPGLPRTDIKEGIRKTLAKFVELAPLGKIKI